MSENSKIQWTHHTFNPWRGCTKATWTDADGKTRLHPGCLNCYAEVDMSVKLHGIKWGKGQERVPKADSGWGEPLRWARKAAAAGERHRVFCASLADVLDSEVPDSMRARLWNTIRETASVNREGKSIPMKRQNIDRGAPGLDWLLLTKRPENWALVPEDVRPLVWLGTSASDQETADKWVPRLLAAEGFRYRFLSVEPLVGPVDLSRWMGWWRCPDCGTARDPTTDQPLGSEVLCRSCPNDTPLPVDGRNVDLVIVGGESGPKARPCNVEWIRSIVRQCAEAGVPCFVKQFGAAPVWPTAEMVPDALWAAWDASEHGAPAHYPVTGGLTDPKGGDWNEWPEDLRVRQFPG